MSKRLTALLLISTSFVLSSCEDKEDDKIFSAQQCMDAAANNPSIVDNCVAIVAGITTSKAYVIRCAADFIREGITNSTIVTAIENLDKNDGSQSTDPNVVLYDAFAFGSPADPTAALAAVESAVTNCTATGSETLTILATSAKIATIIEGVAGGDIQTWLNGNPDFGAVNAQSLEAIGESVVAMQPIACGKGGQFEGTEVCDNLTNAIANGSDNSTIAQQFLDQLSNSND